MKKVFAVALFAAFTFLYSNPARCDVVPGLIKATTDLYQAYETFSTVRKAADDANLLKVKPSVDTNDIKHKYSQAESEVGAIIFPPLPAAPSLTQGPVNSCSSRAQAINALTAGLDNIQSSLNNLGEERAKINDAFNTLQKTTDAVIYIESVLPKIASVPIWGDGVAAEFFSMTKRIRESVGNSETPLKKRLTQNNSATGSLTAALTNWNGALNQARGFSSAPWPPGSYARSCGRCTVTCEQLECDCRRINGSIIRTKVNYPSCSSVENADGSLRCGP